MRFYVGEKLFEIGNGHEIRSCCMTFDEEGDVASISLMHVEGHWMCLPDGVEIGKRPVGLYELKGKA